MYITYMIHRLFMASKWKPVQIRRELHEQMRAAMKGRKDVTSTSMYVDLAVRRQLLEDGIPTEWAAVWWDLFEGGLDKEQLKEFRKWLKDNKKAWKRFTKSMAGRDDIVT